MTLFDLYQRPGSNGGSQTDPTHGKSSRPCIGRVGAPPQKEATSTSFYFWIPRDQLVETTQLVTCESTIAGRTYAFHAIVTEVRQQSRASSMAGEIDILNGDVDYQPPFANDGFAYAEARIVQAPVFTPPQERSPVYLASAEEARLAYGGEDIAEGHSLDIGLIKNGANEVAGAGMIDLDYLLGTNGGHMNVNGSAGRGTKSSFLLFLVRLLLYRAQAEKDNRPSARDRLRVVPIILNVKGFDLFYIDQKSKRYQSGKHLADWQALGIQDPQPFQQVSFFAPETQHTGLAVPIPGRGGQVQCYSWSLSDIIARGLFPYLFAEIDANDANFGSLVLDLENWLTTERPESGKTIRILCSDSGTPQTFRELLVWISKRGASEDESKWRNHHPATWKKLYRRLSRLVYDCQGVLRIDEQKGTPLSVVRADTCNPLVVDLSTLAGKSEIQRFVVATIFRQLIEATTGTQAVEGLVYLVTLDELNRFAPKGASDAITKVIEMVASEMRSQGVILLGAQQQASKVSEKVIENAALRVLGRTGTLELDTAAWRFLSSSAKHKAMALSPNEKLILQDNFREPMHIRVPFPAWAMNSREVLLETDPDADILTF